MVPPPTRARNGLRLVTLGWAFLLVGRLLQSQMGPESGVGAVRLLFLLSAGTIVWGSVPAILGIGRRAWVAGLALLGIALWGVYVGWALLA